MADPTFEEFVAKNLAANNPTVMAAQNDPGKLQLIYADAKRAAHAEPLPGSGLASWGPAAAGAVNSALAAGRQFVQPVANQVARTGENMVGAGTQMGFGKFGEAPLTGVGQFAAQAINPMPGDLQDLGGLAANIGVNALLPGATLGRMALRPLLTAAGSALGGAAQGDINPLKVGLSAAIPAAFEVPGVVSRMRAGINQRPLDNAAAAQYLSRASGQDVPPTGAGIAAARQETGAGSLEEPMWAAYRQKFKDAISMTNDRPVVVTTGPPGEASESQIIPLSQAWDKMSSLPEFYQKRRMMDEILNSLREPLGGAGYQIPPSPGAADLIAGANAPVRMTMSSLQLARNKGALNPSTGDVNMAAWQEAHQRQLMGQQGGDIPTALQGPAQELIRRGQPGATIDQPGIRSGLESGRANIGEARVNAYLSPMRLLEMRFPKLVGVQPPAGWSGVAPAALPATYAVPSLGSMPAPAPAAPPPPDAAAQQAEVQRRLQALEEQQQ